MKLYNTLTRKKETFVPIDNNEVKIYACGPTVYNYIHIGNSRPICVFDVLRRYLEYIGYKVTYAQNFTDIDDKIIKKAIEENTDYVAVSKKYINEYKIDAKGLNIRNASIHPKATENIDEIINIITILIDKGYAYKADNGDVYFQTRKFSDYGKLSCQTLDDLQAGARIQVGESKTDPLDFALWKAAKPGEPFWESPFGNGRPGWHIECSAMARRYLGNTIDIHCGGQDLIFPHHENEIAQSQCCSGVKFANYWIHNGYINVNSQKMSKSLGNFFTVREISDKYGYEPIRYLMIASHYRSPINFSEDIIKQCASALERLYKFKENVQFHIDNKVQSENMCKSFDADFYKNKFLSAMDDDLNTAEAIGVIFEMVKDVNMNFIAKGLCNSEIAKSVMSVFDEMTNVLGILYCDNDKNDNNELIQEVEKLINLRQEARKNKDFKLADEIRDKLNSMNVVIEDTSQGTKFNFK